MRISNSWLFKEAGSVFYAKKMKGLSNQLATLISLHQSIKLATSSKTPLDFQQKNLKIFVLGHEKLPKISKKFDTYSYVYLYVYLYVYKYSTTRGSSYIYEVITLGKFRADIEKQAKVAKALALFLSLNGAHSWNGLLLMNIFWKQYLYEFWVAIFSRQYLQSTSNIDPGKFTEGNIAHSPNHKLIIPEA